MPSFRNARRVAHRAEEMFDLVADVERYPEFLPLCLGTSVKRPVASAPAVLIADMDVGYRTVRERFTTRVTLDRQRLKILVDYVDGPFSHLENIWTFKPEVKENLAITASRVEFFIDYELKSRMLGSLVGSMFDKAFRSFADAFVARADEVYGRRARP